MTLLSTLEHYYDINSVNFFQELFGSLYIGRNKTEFKSSYLVLKLNFSALDTSSREKLEKSFILTVADEILDFLFNYQSIIQNAEEIKKRIESADDLKSILQTLFKAVKQANKKIFLIIDEYDHFANDISASNAYRPTSEREIENGYIDIHLEKDPRIPDIKYEWLIELKYLKKSEEKQIEKAKIEGLEQLRRYANSNEFQGKKNLKKALIIFSGKSDYLIVEE
ncbi:MAG: AAA family ATPase [Alkaliphilus sp.]